MYISGISVKNFKSFNESAYIKLSKGFNIVIGKNSAGKTALLEALSLNFERNPHRSSKITPRRGSPVNPNSIVEISIAIDHDELVEMLGRITDPFLLPLTGLTSTTRSKVDIRNTQEIRDYLDQVWSASELIFNLSVRKGNQGLHFFAQAQSDESILCRFAGERLEYVEPAMVGTGRADITSNIGYFVLQRMYCFRAERLLIARYSVGESKALNPNAENLAEVLLNLSHNPSRFRRFNQCVQKVLPDVRQVSLKIVEGNKVEVSVWSEV